MSRRRKATGDEITLFPFLAVLICTVGSLIVLLVVVVQQAKANAADVSQERAREQASLAEKTQQVQNEIEDFQWKAELLAGSREATAAELERRKEELSYLEDEIRQLRTQLDRAAAEAEHIASLADQESVKAGAAESQLNKLREQLDYARESLAQAREAYRDREASYALLPYVGPNGTRRRPIFIECLADRVVLQPEGIELTENDFQSPLTDDNPLAAALRAKREYLLDASDRQVEPPYPLIVVRPDGAQAYAAARAAMSSWDDEFGYELVESDLKLSYPEVDLGLAEVTREAVAEARARRELLKSIAPARFGRPQQQLLRASRSGGFVARPANDGMPGAGSLGGTRTGAAGGTGIGGREGDGGNPWGGPLPQNAAGNGFGDIAGASRLAGGYPSESAAVTAGPGSRGGRATLEGSAAGPGGLGHQGTGGRAPGGSGARSVQHASATADGLAGNAAVPAANASALPAGSDPHAGVAAAGNSGDGTRGTTHEGTGHRGSSDNGRDPTANAAANRAGSTSSAGSAGQGGASGAGGGNASAANAGALASVAGAGASGAGASGGGGAMGAMGAMSPGPPSLAESRGKGWGLPDSARGATGITRPIVMSCYPDRVVLFPEDPSEGRPYELKLNGPLRNDIDLLVTHVRERMDAWGIAGVRMYWRPVLQVQVQRGADARFEELVSLLDDSGIDIKRK